MDRATFRDICRSRKRAFGTYVMEHMTPHTVRTLARAGFDWLWLENEHSPHSYETIQEVIHSAEHTGIHTLLRVAQTDYSLIAKALDMGAGGIIVPRVETPEQVQFIVDSAKYPPVGKRGFGIRPTLYGRQSVSMRERIEDQNNFRTLVIQLESRQGVDNLETLLEAGKGQVDAVFIGPADFQMDLGMPDTPDAPELLAALERIPKVSAQFGVSSGIPVKNLEEAELRLRQGYNLVSISSDDAFMANAAEAACRGLRGLTQGR